MYILPIWTWGKLAACYVWSIPEGKWNDLVHHPIETSIFFNNFFQVPGFLPISIISLPPTKSAKLPWCWTTGSSPVIGRWGPNWKLLYGDGRTRCAGNFDGKNKPKMDGFCVKLGGIPDVFLLKKIKIGEQQEMICLDFFFGIVTMIRTQHWNPPFGMKILHICFPIIPRIRWFKFGLISSF